MTLGMVIGGLSFGFMGLFLSMMGTAVGMALFMIAYSFGGMGAGDVKLMGVVGSFLGAKNVIWACLFSGISGGIFGLFYLIYRGNAKSYLIRYYNIIKTLLIMGKIYYIPPAEEEKKMKFPYGIAIASGTIIFIFWGNHFIVN